MRFDPKDCPVCGEEARGTLKQVWGVALLQFGVSGEAEYTGETDILWDSQTSETGPDGEGVVLCCSECSHEWTAAITYEAPIRQESSTSPPEDDDSWLSEE